MIDLAIQKGFIQKADTSDPAQKGSFYFLRKLFSDYLNKLGVPFYDSCCPAVAESKPVRFNSGIQYFNGSTWVSTSSIAVVAQENKTGAGAASVSSYYTAWTTVAAVAGSLPVGTYSGQLKKITLVVDGGDLTLTPASLIGGTTITFNDVSDSVILGWNGTNWVIVESNGVVIA